MSNIWSCNLVYNVYYIYIYLSLVFHSIFQYISSEQPSKTSFGISAPSLQKQLSYPTRIHGTHSPLRIRQAKGAENLAGTMTLRRCRSRAHSPSNVTTLGGWTNSLSWSLQTIQKWESILGGFYDYNKLKNHALHWRMVACGPRDHWRLSSIYQEVIGDKLRFPEIHGIPVFRSLVSITLDQNYCRRHFCRIEWMIWSQNQ